jgi:peptidyl-prolyl cis-trans isomerase SurA
MTLLTCSSHYGVPPVRYNRIMKSCALLLLFTGFVSAADVAVVEEIVCKVNGDIISRTELERDRRETEAQLRQQGLSGARLQEALDNTVRNLLRERIDRLLLVQKGKELDIKVDSDVTKQIADIQRRTGISDPEKFQQFVHEQTGQPFEDYKADLKNGLLQQRVIRQEVASKIQFKKEELMDYYDNHKDQFQRKERVFLSEIFISTEGKDPAGVAAAEKKAKDLAARARKGEKFPELAQSNSDNPTTAQQGGDMGAFEKGQLRPDFEAAVWDQPRGFVSDPIRMTNGFEIVKVNDHQKEGLAAFEEVEAEVTDKVFNPRMEPALRAYLTKLRTEAFLEIKPGYVDSGAAPGKDTAWSDPAQLIPETVTKEEVLAKPHRRKLLWMVPIPGTSTTKAGTSSSH